jgi:hypothetical protein
MSTIYNSISFDMSVEVSRLEKVDFEGYIDTRFGKLASLI